jgi:hypothetical protein
MLTVAPLFSPSSPLLSSWPLDLSPLYPPPLLFSLRWGHVAGCSRRCWGVLLGWRPPRRCSRGRHLYLDNALILPKVRVFFLHKDRCLFDLARRAPPTARSSQLRGHAPWPWYWPGFVGKTYVNIWIAIQNRGLRVNSCIEISNRDPV